MTAPDRQQLIDSLRSTVCPVCGRKKKTAHTLCNNHYFGLPTALQRALYQRVHTGYEQAFAKAMAHYDVAEPHWPEPSMAKATNPDLHP